MKHVRLLETLFVDIPKTLYSTVNAGVTRVAPRKTTECLKFRNSPESNVCYHRCI